jgi:hypothetical protein
VFAPEIEATVAADAVVRSMGRVPLDSLAPARVERSLHVEEAGDCRMPRNLEEAILAGALAAAALARRAAAVAA